MTVDSSQQLRDRAELEKDAARYRWMMAQGPTGWPCVITEQRIDDASPRKWPVAFTAAIDARMGNSTSAASAKPSSLHPATRDLVDRFAQALANKLAAAEKKYGYSDGWANHDWQQECVAKLLEHVLKGDPRDVAAYCAFAWHHGWTTAPTAITKEVVKWITNRAANPLSDLPHRRR